MYEDNPRPVIEGIANHLGRNSEDPAVMNVAFLAATVGPICLLTGKMGLVRGSNRIMIANHIQVSVQHIYLKTVFERVVQCAVIPRQWETPEMIEIGRTLFRLICDMAVEGANIFLPRMQVLVNLWDTRLKNPSWAKSDWTYGIAPPLTAMIEDINDDEETRLQ